MASTDLQLVKRLLGGDGRAMQAFFDEQFPRLYRFAVTRLDRDPHLAEEIVQIAMCRAVDKLETYRGDAPLFSWLCTFCRYEISAHFKKIRRRGPTVALEDDTEEIRRALQNLAEHTDGPGAALDREETERIVHETLDGLPPPYGDVLEWKYILGLPVKEIARRLKIGEKAAESTLTRARAAFRAVFDDGQGPAARSVREHQEAKS